MLGKQVIPRTVLRMYIGGLQNPLSTDVDVEELNIKIYQFLTKYCNIGCYVIKFSLNAQHKNGQDDSNFYFILQEKLFVKF